MATFRTKKSVLRTFKPKPRVIPKGNHLMVIESLSEDGRGIARVAGKTVFVAGALPDEQVKARYTIVHKNFDEAVAVEIVLASKVRIKPACEYAEKCGGCMFQHLDYAEQVSHKQRLLHQQFKRFFSSEDSPLPSTITASALHYRHRAKLMVNANKQGVNIGFRQKQSHQLISIDHCKIMYRSLSDQIPLFKTIIAALKERSSIVELSVCEDSNGLKGIKLHSKKHLKENDLSVLEQAAITHNMLIEVELVNKNIDDFHWSSSDIPLHYQLSNQSINLPFTLNDFTQVNPKVNQQLIDCAIEWLDLKTTDSLADYFCGLGNFSLAMAQDVSSVMGYELSISMVKKANSCAASNNITNASFRVANLFTDNVTIDSTATKILLDPPRSGADQLCKKLSESNAQRIVYISCNPKTLFRDTEILTAKNFQLKEIKLADMFPQTNHSEVIALFIRNQ